MSLILYQSNRLEALADELSRIISKEQEEKFGFFPELIIVNNYEMGQWLSIYLAEKNGIVANIKFSLLGSFVWEIAANALSLHSEEVITRQRMCWAIYQTLKEMMEDVKQHYSESELFSYLDIQGEQGLFHLSKKLEIIFDRYLNHRYQMLKNWEEGEEPSSHKWQKELWLRLGKKFQGNFRISLLKKFLNDIGPDFKLWQDTTDLLSKSLYIFGVSYLSPIHLDTLEALSSSLDIHVFLLNPCRKYWLDIVPRKFQERMKAANKLTAEEIDAFFPVGNELLASMGRAGRSFLFRLYGIEFQDASKDIFEKNCSKHQTMLAQIQEDILDLHGLDDNQKKNAINDKIIVSSKDSSILINSCYSRLREVEALYSYLVELFNSDTNLNLNDIAVLTPDISKYAPFIQAVFGSAPKDRYIPFQIADLGPLEQDEASKAFISLFGFATKEFKAPELLDLIELPLISERWGFDQKAILRIKNWIEKSAIRRGFAFLSPSVRETQNTWLFGLNRLFVTASMSGNEILEKIGIAPVDELIEGDGFLVLLRLSALVHELKQFIDCASVEGGLTIKMWKKLSKWLIERFISASFQNDPKCTLLLERLNLLFDAISFGGVEKLTYAVMNEAIKDTLQSPETQRAFFSGKLLFASLVPMRSLPFKVICLMGMNDDDFPRKEKSPSFDLITASWNPGDRNPRDEDRYLFIETIISARQRLWISYVGKREKDDTEQNPSSVVSELIDYIDKRFALPDGGKVSKNIIIEHPLQPFSHKYFYRESGLPSNWSLEWLPVNENGKILHRDCPKPLLAHYKTIDIDEETIAGLFFPSPNDFALAFINSAKWFLEKILGIYLGVTTKIVKDHEPFSIEADIEKLILKELKNYSKINIKSLKSYLPQLYKIISSKLRAQGLIPIGTFGDIALLNAFKGLEKDFFKLIKRLQAVKPSQKTATANITLSQIVITGALGNVGENGGIVELMGKKPYPYMKLSLWLRHLMYCMNVNDEEVTETKSRIVSPHTEVIFSAVEPSIAVSLLEELCQIYINVLTKGPLPLPCTQAYDYAKKLNPKKGKKITEDDDLHEIKYKIFKGLKRAVESKKQKGDLWFEYTFRQSWINTMRLLIEDPMFHYYSQKIYEPLLKHLEKGR